jgi:hypothetical protein
MDNPFAFPHQTEFDPVHGKEKITDGGMTLLDYFAGQAMAGMLSNPDRTIFQDKHTSLDEVALGYAAAAYRQANAMLAERSK